MRFTFTILYINKDCSFCTSQSPLIFYTASILMTVSRSTNLSFLTQMHIVNSYMSTHTQATAQVSRGLVINVQSEEAK